MSASPSARSPGGPLAGRRIVVTRPAHQADALAAGIAGAGGEPVRFPLLEIGPAPDPAPLAAVIRRLDDYAWAIFISPNAVEFSLPAANAARPWPPCLRVAAIGPGTVAALAGHGLTDVVAPATRFESEGLLAEPALQRVAGQRIAVFRGDGGRELLGETLAARGAAVDLVTCYSRRPPGGDVAALAGDVLAGRIDAITVSSSEGLRHFVNRLGGAQAAVLERLPLFAPHPRIVETARTLGFRRVELTAAADAGLLAGLCAYNWPAR